MADTITEIARQMLLDQAAVQEKALEQAIQGGEYGVSTIHNGLQCSSRVDPLIPYGRHFIFPSREAYDIWINRGAHT